MRGLFRGGSMAALALLVSAAVAAQVQVEKRTAAPPAGVLAVENSFGSVTVKAWSDPEVLVRGVLAAGAEGLDFDGDEEGVGIDVDVPDAWFYASDDDSEYRTDLTIYAPVGSSVWVETVNASVVVEGFRGEVEVETVNGSVSVSGGPTAVEVDSLTGTIDVRAEGAPMAVESISGRVSLSGVTGEVEVETVSGAVEVEGWDLESVQVQTTSGDVRFRGAVCIGAIPEGELEVETFSGAVRLELPASIRARFELTTFAGEITNELGPSVSSAERFQPYKTLRFSTGLDDCEVMVQTHDSNIGLSVLSE